jgi:hypothetical protein
MSENTRDASIAVNAATIAPLVQMDASETTRTDANGAAITVRAERVVLRHDTGELVDDSRPLATADQDVASLLARVLEELRLIRMTLLEE